MMPAPVQGKDGRSRLEGWSRNRRIVILRQRIERSLALTERDANGQSRLSFAEIVDGPGLGSTPCQNCGAEESLRSRASDKKLISDGSSFLGQRGV
jgi:hypothetical protein